MTLFTAALVVCISNMSAIQLWQLNHPMIITDSKKCFHCEVLQATKIGSMYVMLSYEDSLCCPTTLAVQDGMCDRKLTIGRIQGNCGQTHNRCELWGWCVHGFQSELMLFGMCCVYASSTIKDKLYDLPRSQLQIALFLPRPVLFYLELVQKDVERCCTPSALYYLVVSDR